MSWSEQETKKELLLEAKDFALHDFVVRIQDFGDVLGMHLVLDGAVVIAVIERREVKRIDRFSFP
jgi:hypothetical protein